MKEKKYLLLLREQALKEQAREKRVVCGFNQNAYGEAVVTTGIPRQYEEGQTTYIEQKTMSYDDYIISQMQKTAKRRR